jgi:sugar phosphate permease
MLKKDPGHQEFTPTVEKSQAQPRFRFVVMGALWITVFFLFLDRVNISMAAPYIMNELGLTGVEMGFILSIYYWGYLVGQLGGGMVADRFSIRKWAVIMYCFWCVLTVLTGLCRSLVQFTVVRGLFGVSEGAVANPIHKLENHWILPHERGWVYGTTMGFGYLGLILGMPLVGWLIQTWGWRVMFYGTGVLTILGVVIFWLLVYDHPREHPWISDAEKDLIEETVNKDRVTYDPHQGLTRTLSFGEGVRMLVANWAFWSICVAGFFALGVFFTNLSWLPGYLVKERGFTVMSSGIYLALPYLAAFAGALSCGYVGDRTGNRSAVGLCTGLLTVPAIVGLMLSQDVTMVILCMSLVLFLNAATVNTLIVLLFDLLPAEILGIAMGVFAGIFGGLGGVIGPLVLGYSLDATGSFVWGFISLALGILAGSCLLVPVLFHEKRIKREKLERATLGSAAEVAATS